MHTRRKFIRNVGRWVLFTAGAVAATGCDSSTTPTSPTETPTPTPAPAPVPVVPKLEGTASRTATLNDILGEAGLKVNNTITTNGKRRFVGLDGGNSEWNIYIGSTLYALNGGNITTDMPTVVVTAGTAWRCAKVSLGFIAAAALLAIGWFWKRRNAIQGHSPTATTVRRRGAPCPSSLHFINS